MGDGLMEYIEWVELESFFSGYLLVYAIFYLLASKRADTGFFKSRLLARLPLAYALLGTIYWGLQLKNGFPGNYFNDATADIQFPYLKVWGLLSILLWIPALHKRTVFSLLHCLPFFFLMMQSFYQQLSFPFAENDMVRNNIKIFSASVLLNLVALFLVTLFYFLIARIKKSKA